MDNFGKKLAELREHKGLSQDQLACDVGISQATVSNYESGATKPNLEILGKFAEYFHVPVTYFFSDEKVIFNTQTNNGVSYFANGTFNAMSEKLIEQYEQRIAQYEKYIALLEQQLYKREE